MFPLLCNNAWVSWDSTLSGGHSYLGLSGHKIEAADFFLSAGLFEVRAQEYLETLPSGEQSGVNRFLKGLGKEPAKPLASREGWASCCLQVGQHRSCPRVTGLVTMCGIQCHVSLCWHAVGSGPGQSLFGGWWRTKDWAMSCIHVF